jgi:hypothetical protein
MLIELNEGAALSPIFRNERPHPRITQTKLTPLRIQQLPILFLELPFHTLDLLLQPRIRQANLLERRMLIQRIHDSLHIRICLARPLSKSIMRRSSCRLVVFLQLLMTLELGLCQGILETFDAVVGERYACVAESVLQCYRQVEGLGGLEF